MNQALELFAASAANKKERPPFRAAALYQNSESFLLSFPFPTSNLHCNSLALLGDLKLYLLRGSSIKNLSI